MAASARWIVLAALAAGIASVGALNGAASSGKSQATTRPNIIVFMTDDQTVDESMRVMPNVRRLIVDQGVTFDNSFVSYSLCCPSRATFLTGQYAHNHGVCRTRPPSGGYCELKTANTLPVWLGRAGYDDDPRRQVPERVRRRSKPRDPARLAGVAGSVDPSTYRYLDFMLNENGALVSEVPRRRYQTDVYAEKAWRSCAAARPRRSPFFVWVTFLGLHTGGPREAADPACTRRRRFRAGTSTASRASRCPHRRRSTRRDVLDKPA